MRSISGKLALKDNPPLANRRSARQSTWSKPSWARLDRRASLREIDAVQDLGQRQENLRPGERQRIGTVDCRRTDRWDDAGAKSRLQGLEAAGNLRPSAATTAAAADSHCAASRFTAPRARGKKAFQLNGRTGADRKR